jgi:hypothetical protein
MKHTRNNTNLDFGGGFLRGNEFAVTKKGYMQPKEFPL